jgi:hypothetical protein
MSVLPRNAIIVVSLNDLNEKAKQELLKDDPKSRDFTLKEAIGMICEQVDSRYYLLNAKRFLKVRLEK